MSSTWEIRHYISTADRTPRRSYSVVFTSEIEHLRAEWDYDLRTWEVVVEYSSSRPRREVVVEYSNSRSRRRRSGRHRRVDITLS
jgi:hypothetical protein